MAEAVSIKTIEEAVAALVKLATPPDKPNNTSAYGFQLSKNTTTLYTYLHLWEKSVVAEASLLENDLRTKLHEWILKKTKIFETALRNQVALHFDIFVLGIVSVLYYCVLW